jgi:hypothetical protein
VRGTAVALLNTSVVDRESIESSLARQFLRTVGELYVMMVPAAAIVVLLTTQTGQRGTVLAILLAPIAFGYASIAIRSGSLSLAAWRKRRTRANVGRELGEVGREYRILSRCSVTPGREDHIAIGPNGIFVIMACDDSGRVTASSRRLFVNARLPWRDLIDDCRIDTLRVRERVRRAVGRSLPVHSVLCFARALVAVGQEIQGVKVVQAPRLARLIVSTAAPMRLSEREIERAASALTEANESQRPRPLARRSRRSRPEIQSDRRLALVGRVPAHHHER